MLASLVDIIFPPVCPFCEERPGKDHLCPVCAEAFSRLRVSSPVCTTCGIPFPAGRGPGHMCQDCILGRPAYEEARSAYLYDGAVLEAVSRLKYGGRTILAGPLGRLAAEGAVFGKRPDIVMPVPLHPKRLKTRGFNQSLLLAREVAGYLGARLDYLGLKRSRDTGPQVGLSHDKRMKNVAGAFDVGRIELKGATVLLVDDVMTTGATINECARVLKEAGARVLALTLARTQKV